jgi:predicted ester cyclase
MSRKGETGSEASSPAPGDREIVVSPCGRRLPSADNLKDIFRTFPDWKLEIVEMVAEGDSVVVCCRVSGTHRGVAARAVNGGFLVGVQPTGKHFEVQHIHWYKVRDGMITDHSTSRDDLGMTQQLGLLPPHQ